MCAHGNSMDWNTIRQEYVTDDSSSYRKLVKKYGVPYSTLSERAKRENWTGQRNQFRDRSRTKSLDALVRCQARRAERLQGVADKLLDKIERTVDAADTEELLSDSRILKNVTDALRGIKEIQMIRSEADEREQEARIASLERQTHGDAEGELRVVFASEAEELSE